ncbi:MAG: DNA methyltransferase [Candidatus Magasanikbacteria bacterium]
MNKYLFSLGHQPHISIAEIQAVFSRLQINTSTEQPTNSAGRQNNTFFIIKTKDELNCEELINKLGGTIKIAKKIIPPTDGPPIRTDSCPRRRIPAEGGKENNITDFLAKTPPEFKIQFSLSGPNSKKIAMAVKKELKTMGRSVRYIEPKNTATILHNKLIKKQGDLTIFEDEIFVTKAIQPFEEFGERDYKRPGTDSFSGMLPPKLARIMINLGISNVETRHCLVSTPNNFILLDPFCGSGTVLTEAIDLGFTNLIGSDISEKAIEDTKKNIEWQIKSYRLSAISYQSHLVDATKLSTKLKPNSVDLIVSEPYLGKPLRGNENKLTLQKQTNDLADLYTKAFKEFYKTLKKDGIVIFIIPKFKYKDEWVEIDCLDKIKKAGFKIIPLGMDSPPCQGGIKGGLTYHRPKQHVARVIWGFKIKE